MSSKGTSHPSEAELVVDATISEWREGKKGRYAIAALANNPQGVERALCFYTTQGRTPPVGSAFSCRIRSGERGWKIVEILSGVPFQSLEDVELTVVSAGSSIKVEFDHEGTRYSGDLPKEALYQSKLAEVRFGAVLQGNVSVRPDNRILVEDILWPQQADILPPEESLSQGAPQADLYFPVLRFRSDDMSGAAIVWSEDLGVALSVVIKKFHLKKVSLDELSPRDGREETCQDQLKAAYELARERESKPRGPGYATRPDIIRGVLTWNDGDQRWSLKAISGPHGKDLPPGVTGDRIDWIEATVATSSVDVPEGVCENTVMSEAKLHKGSYVELSAHVQGEEVRARCYLDRDRPWNAAALAQGRRVVVSLLRRETYWSAEVLHRILPR